VQQRTVAKASIEASMPEQWAEAARTRGGEILSPRPRPLSTLHPLRTTTRIFGMV
jgi:hypothetical protein